jgi:hypothetical protein
MLAAAAHRDHRVLAMGQSVEAALR